MKYAVEMGPGAVLYISSFINTDSVIKTFREEECKDKQRACRSHKPIFMFSK
jgi:hypothetical protein